MSVKSGKIIYVQLLPRLGINRNIFKPLRTVPRCFGGVGLPDMHLEKCIEKLEHLITHSIADMIDGKLLLTSAEQLQLEVGVGTPFLQLNFEEWEPLVTYCWLEDLWQDITNYKVEIQWKQLPQLKLQRVNDRYLMDIFREELGKNHPHLPSLNRVRLHLRAYSLADISTGDGTQIHPSVRDPTKAGMWRQQKSSLSWPRERPSTLDWVR